MPLNLSADFFSVCQTAIKNAAWRYEDFVRVRGVEGELERLLLAQSADGTLPVGATPPMSATLPEDGEVTPGGDKILSPDEAKKAPVRAMPENILEMVKVGVEAAKNSPPVAPVKVETLPSDPAAAAAAFNKNF